jgi:hypothetical protein
MINKNSAVLFMCFFSLSGCAKDYSLAPPANSQQITVTVKVPKELKARSMKVMYRSTLCTFTSRTASGVPYKRYGYQNADIEPIQRGQSDLYDAKLPIDGGGACQWRLSNVTFGVVYENPSQFGDGITYGAGGGVVVAFDSNKPSRSGPRIQVDGDLTIIKDYYPWVSETFLGQYTHRVSLIGEGDIYLGYQALQAKHVYFEPVLHSGFVLRSVEPKEKKKGNYTIFTLPDGRVLADGRPDTKFSKLQEIRMAAEAKQ